MQGRRLGPLRLLPSAYPAPPRGGPPNGARRIIIVGTGHVEERRAARVAPVSEIPIPAEAAGKENEVQQHESATDEDGRSVFLPHGGFWNEYTYSSAESASAGRALLLRTTPRPSPVVPIRGRSLTISPARPSSAHAPAPRGDRRATGRQSPPRGGAMSFPDPFRCRRQSASAHSRRRSIPA